MNTFMIALEAKNFIIVLIGALGTFFGIILGGIAAIAKANSNATKIKALEDSNELRKETTDRLIKDLNKERKRVDELEAQLKLEQAQTNRQEKEIELLTERVNKYQIALRKKDMHIEELEKKLESQ